MTWNIEGISSGESSGQLNRELFIDSAGLNPNIVPVFKFGLHDSIGIGSEEDVWTVGGELSYLSSAETISVESSSGSDTLDIVLTGVDGSYELLTETVTLNGTTPVVTAGQFLRVWRVARAEGESAINVGTVTGIASVAASVQFQIEAGIGQTEMSHFTVPLGFTGFVFSVFSTASRNDAAIIRIKTRAGTDSFVTGSTLEVSTSISARYFEQYPIAFAETTDVKFTAQAVTNNTRVTASYRVVLVKNDYIGA